MAVTSAMKQEWLLRGPEQVGEVVDQYETYKQNYHDTGQRCVERGFAFEPLVFEAHSGGWEAAVVAVLTMVGVEVAGGAWR